MGCRTLAGNASCLLMVLENLWVKTVGFVRLYRVGFFFYGFSSVQEKKKKIKSENISKTKKSSQILILMMYKGS